MTATVDSAARAALWEAWRHHGRGPWTPTDRNPRSAQYARALLLGWLWSPRAGVLAITPEGMDALEPYMPRGGE